MSVEWWGHTKVVETLKPYLLQLNSFELLALRCGGNTKTFAYKYLFMPSHPSCLLMPLALKGGWCPCTLHTLMSSLSHALVCLHPSCLLHPHTLVLFYVIGSMLHTFTLLFLIHLLYPHSLMLLYPCIPHACQGITFDTLNLTQGHQKHSQCQGCISISLICMSLLYNTQS